MSATKELLAEIILDRCPSFTIHINGTPTITYTLTRSTEVPGSFDILEDDHHDDTHGLYMRFDTLTAAIHEMNELMRFWKF